MDHDLVTLDQILTGNLPRTPAMQVQDFYKWLPLAARGSCHAIRDEKMARTWLEREMDEMGNGPDDPLLDPLSPDGQILRVHLRPFLREGRDPDLLLQAFFQTPTQGDG